MTGMMCRHRTVCITPIPWKKNCLWSTALVLRSITPSQSQKEYFHIVVELARKNGVTEEQMSDETLRAEANKWELSHGGISGRTAQQFINYILGTL